MRTFDKIITDRGSKYAVSGAPCRDGGEARALVEQLRKAKRFARATHNSWGLLGADGPVKNDDGESGAGMIILQQLEAAGMERHLVIVTRWYGGKHLGGDRFRHVRDAVAYYLAALEAGR
ncbi:YigZ family protein [Novosphingobium sp. 1949]|uniref:YigZ family protein n=1 Tax=Novosphingobium organovorum TaxID=2930092 RepID=A0ABT0BIA7_9SPHN|nr:YigZ family protein [Novosphingobium organovorum]MCJ2184796.1 YigZ family protein [Novosphingobium organovorum]